MKHLEWNVVRYDFNSKAFESYNVLGNWIVDEIKIKTKTIDNRKDFSETVRRIFQYHFWSKCEWEIVIREWAGHDNPTEMKVDVYDQLILNWDRFIDYVWSNINCEG